MKMFDFLFKKSNKKAQNTQIRPKMIRVLMPDGTIESYNENFAIDDGKHCVVCHSKSYHTYFSCPYFRDEQDTFHDQVRGMTIKDAEAEFYQYCHRCKEYEELDKE